MVLVSKIWVGGKHSTHIFSLQIPELTNQLIILNKITTIIKVMEHFRRKEIHLFRKENSLVIYTVPSAANSLLNYCHERSEELSVEESSAKYCLNKEIISLHAIVASYVPLLTESWEVPYPVLSLALSQPVPGTCSDKEGQFNPS